MTGSCRRVKRIGGAGRTDVITAESYVEKLVPRVICILAETASRRGTITYGSLAGLVNTHPRVIVMVLKRILKMCAKNKLPPLPAIVVNKRTGRPGCSFYEQSFPGPEFRADCLAGWEGMMDKVYSFNWSHLEPGREKSF